MSAIHSSLLVLLCFVLYINQGQSNAEKWSPCLGSCPSLLSNRSCPIVNGNCTCQRTNESNFCDPVDQQLLTNLTGSWQPNATDCCYCSSTQRYCCQQCNSTEQINTTAAATTTNPVPSNYFRVLIFWRLECAKYNTAGPDFTNSFIAAMSDTTKIKAKMTVHNISCVSGKTPYCGVDVGNIKAHHRARRLAAGGRAKMAGGGKKSDDDDDDNNYSNGQYRVVSNCGGVTINMTAYADQNALETLRAIVLNGSLVLSLSTGNISAGFMLSAMKGDSYSLQEAPTPPIPTRAPLEIPPLETDLKPMMMGFGAAVFVLLLFLLYSCIRHTVLLRMNKFTDVNSDAVEPEKKPPPELVKTEEEKAQEEEELKAKEEKERKRKMGPSYDMTHTSIPYGNNDAIRRYDWTTPAYVPSMLAAVPRSKELYGQSQPRLILDDEESEDEKSSGSDVNINEDEILCDEESSEDERSQVPLQTPPRSVSSLYRKPATPARNTSRQDVRSSSDAARPQTAESQRPSSAQSRKAPTPIVVREEADITEPGRSASGMERPSTASRPSSSRSVKAVAPAMQEEGDSSMQPGRPPSSISVKGEEQRPGSARISSEMNQASSLPRVC